MLTGREVVDTIREAFDLFSEMELPLKEREVTIMYEAALPLIGYIERLEAAQLKWISVAERLPEIDDLVLVIANGKPHENISLENAFLIASYWGDEGWIADGFDGWDKLNVTHWMPLPPGPNDSKEE